MTTAVGNEYKAADGSVAYEFAVPEYPNLGYAFCTIGLHLLSRKPVVKGWVRYFSRIEHHYCACGQRRWMWFEDGWVHEETVRAGTREEWIENQRNVLP
jgi:hypothetical protein